MEYDHLLHDDPEWQEAAKWFAKRVMDISTILVEQGRPLEFTSMHPEESPIRVTYQDSCHLRNVMKGGNHSR